MTGGYPLNRNAIRPKDKKIVKNVGLEYVPLLSPRPPRQSPHTPHFTDSESFKSVEIKVVMTFLMTVINCGSQCITEKLINKYTCVTITNGKVIQ